MSDTQSPVLPKHIQWLAQHRGTALRQKLAQDRIFLSVDAALDIFMQADPDPGLRATQWLVDTYLDGRMLWEDVSAGASSKAGETLVLFAQHRGGLVGPVRNLVNHAGLASLYKAIQPCLEVVDEDATPTGRALRRAQRAQARMESIIIHESPELRLVVPTTQSAAQWWGRGTRWCTSAESNNMFDQYNDSAPLIIVVLPKTRFQLWIGKNSCQFMDEADDNVAPAQVALNWASLQPLIEWACTRRGSLLRLVPLEARTACLCRKIVGGDGMALAHVPAAVLDREMCLSAVTNNGQALQHVPPAFKDNEVCRLAMEQNHTAFEYLPDGLQTIQGCLDTIRRSAPMRPIFWIPQRLHTPQVVLAAIARNGNCLEWVDLEERTLEMCTAAIDSNSRRLMVKWADVPARHRLDVYHHAMSRGHNALTLLSPEQMTPDIVHAAVRAHPHALEDVPSGLCTPELYREAIGAHGIALRHLPFDARSPELCRLALEQNPIALAYVPYSRRTRELCILALQGAVDGHIQISVDTKPETNILNMVSDQMRDAEIYALARQIPDIYMHPPVNIVRIPVEYRTRKMCEEAVKKWSGALSHVPPSSGTWKCVPLPCREWVLTRLSCISPPSSANACPSQPMPNPVQPGYTRSTWQNWLHT